MKKKNKGSFILIVTILIMLEFASVFLMYKSSTAKETKLDDVRLKEPSKNSFAIMLETSDGTYQESESSLWPTNMKYNSDKSGCIDNSGNKIENALSFDSTNNLATVSTQGTSYCYLYFDLDKTGPVITNVVDAGEGKITFTVTDELNEVSEYCVNGSATDTSDCTWYEAIEGTQTTGSIVADSGTYYVHVSDILGNIGHSSVVTMEVSKPIGEYILANPNTGLNTTLEGGLYRYQGTAPNNYICFGYSDYESDCDFTNTTNSDLYAYRIIGINSSGQLKLIKKEALNSTMAWNSSNGVTWPESEIYNGINGDYYLSNSTYMSSGWSNKISDTSWKYGDITTYNTTALSVYTTENGWTSTTNAKIGLMYMHDYYYAYQSGGLNCSSSGSYTTCKTAWLHLSNCDSGAPNTNYEWTMSRYGLFGSDYVAWSVNLNGYIANISPVASVSIRPVFYLTSDVQYVSGTGTSTDPFIIQ